MSAPRAGRGERAAGTSFAPTRARTLALALALAGLLAPRPARAHPFGQSSVNRLLAVQLGDDRSVRIAYVLDLGELPSYAEITVADRDGDGAITPAERDAYLDARLPRWMSQWRVQLDGRDATLRVLSRGLEAPQGEGGMNTLRVLAEVEVESAGAGAGAVAVGGEVRVRVEDRGFAERPGWREIRAEDSDAGRVVSSTAPTAPPPGGGAVRMLRVDEAEFVLRALPAAAATTPRGVNAVPTEPAAPAWFARMFPGRAWAARRGAYLLALALTSLLAALAVGALLGRATDGLRRTDARARLLACALLAVSAATLRAAQPGALVVHAALALGLIVAARPRPRWALGRVAAALAWGAFLGGARALGARGHAPGEAVALGARAAVALAAMVPLAARTGATELADALAGLGLPAALAETTAATARGLWLLRDEAARVARARALRAPDAGPAERVGLYGSWAGAVVARGMERARRAQMAMELRGYDGAARGARWKRVRLRAGDVALVAGCAAAALAARGAG